MLGDAGKPLHRKGLVHYHDGAPQARFFGPSAKALTFSSRARKSLQFLHTFSRNSSVNRQRLDNDETGQEISRIANK